MTTATSAPPSLTRAGFGRPAAPVRMVHLGLGNFTRAHQAWYTEHAPDAARWGIAAFAGRAAGITTELNAQDGLFTLLVRGRDGDEPEVISSLSAIHSGADLAAWRGYLASPDVAILTTTPSARSAPALKSFLIKQASGLAGPAPKLLRGEAI